MGRAAFYIDGFNLYHSLKSHPKTTKALWLDLWSMCDALRARADTLDRVVYFTALTFWNKHKERRHQTYLTALESRGVEVVHGRFSPVQRECLICGKLYDTHEEKETDVNLASRIILDAASGAVEVIYLLTGDTDQVPTIKAVRQLAPAIEVVALIPINTTSDALKRHAHRQVKLGWGNIAKNQLPNPVRLPSGRELSCPGEWMSPEPTPSSPS